MFSSNYGTLKKQMPEVQTPEVPLVRRLSVFQALLKSNDGCSNRVFEWESKASPWTLLTATLSRVGQSIPALLLLWWTMGYKKDQLMHCDTREHALASVCLCEYTKAYIRVFPLLAVNLCLTMAMRLILQERIYYGFLRAGALLDFENINPWKSVQLWLLVWSLVHCLGHFILKYFTSEAWRTADWQDDKVEIQAIGQKFLVPSFLFISLFVKAVDIEAMLIPLNKYVEEDLDLTPKMLGCMTILEEKRLRSDVASTDIIAEVQEPPAITNVYEYIIRAHAQLSCYEEEVEFAPLLSEMWPAILLVDSRLKDDDSAAFRRMFAVFLVLGGLVLLGTGTYLMTQALKDLLIDCLQHGHTEDAIACFVLSAHAILIAWVMNQCARRGKLWRLWARPKR